MHDWHFINFPFFLKEVDKQDWVFWDYPTQPKFRNTYFSSDKKLWNPNHIYNTARYVKRDQYSAPLHTVTVHCQYIMRNKRDLLRNWYKLFNRLLSNYLIIVGNCLFYFPKRSLIRVCEIKKICRVIASGNKSRLEGDFLCFVLCTVKLISWLVTHVRTRDSQDVILLKQWNREILYQTSMYFLSVSQSLQRKMLQIFQPIKTRLWNSNCRCLLLLVEILVDIWNFHYPGFPTVSTGSKTFAVG